MDPNATLHRMREISGDYAACTPFCIAGCRRTVERYAGEMIDLFEALDEWLSKGGFLTEEWKGNR